MNEIPHQDAQSYEKKTCGEVSNLETARRRARGDPSARILQGLGRGGKDGGKGLSREELRTVHSVAEASLRAKSHTIEKR